MIDMNSKTFHSHQFHKVNKKFNPLTAKSLTKSSIIGLLSIATVASSFVIPAQEASANGCRISSFANQVFQLTNTERSRFGLRPLRFSCRLYEAAKIHTIDMARNRRMSHTGSDGSRLGDRVNRVGYPYSRVGENVAYGQRTPEAVVRSWMNSQGHRQNILNPNFTEIGVAHSHQYWTQVFGTSR